jgi:hypothetical protein
LSARTITGAALFAAVIAAFAAAARPGGAADEEGERAFGEVARVLLSPRCRNCHPAGDAPLHGDERPFPHTMSVSRKSEAAGLHCTACHREANAPDPGAPPGAAGWRMPPAETPMVFEGRTPHDLCLQLKDPTKTGGRDLAALREHLGHDALVLWAWSPGPGRARPPLSHDELVRNVGVWIDRGAPCPR